MDSSSQLPAKRLDQVAEPLVGAYVASASLRWERDLSDWVELMEVVEALCPMWLEREITLDYWKSLP